MSRKSATALTPEQVRARFRARGITFTQWALDRGLDPKAVSRVLNGTDKGRYGQSHRIAVELGLKVEEEGEPGTTSSQCSTYNNGRKEQTAEAA